MKPIVFGQRSAWFLLLIVTSVAYGGVEILDYDPVANPEAVIVVSGNARFTILTPSLIRLEYSTGQFEDLATIAFLNRNLSVPAYSSAVVNGVLEITTDAIRLQYTVGSAFSSSSLAVTSIDGSSTFKSWYFGQPNTGNLLGTYCSLDVNGVLPLNCTLIANNTDYGDPMHCEWGLISREGWAVVDDSENWALDSEYWWAGENSDDIDYYLFAHGANYRQALADFVQVSGRIALVPRYSTGAWWTRWSNVDNFDAMQIIDNYRSRSIPLDVYIFDMDWHTKNDWSGYTWDTRLFPYPVDTLNTIHSLGLHVSVNIHDKNGVGPWEQEYVPYALAVGIDPLSQATVPFNLSNSTWAYALEDIVIKPRSEEGIDFWWNDGTGGVQAGLTGQKQNPDIWSAHLHCTDHQRRNENIRGLVLSRWGGLGQHRYQVGFSGDVSALSWENLAFQPYFTMTASNVGFGFWSHDVMGPYDSYEMFVRWVQWAAFSGVFRSHDRGQSTGPCADNNPSTCAIVEVWEVPSPYFESNRGAIQRRLSLVPYIYNAWRQAFDTGLGIVRPMYYDYPLFANAYNAQPNGSYPQYMFGDDILVSPIVSPNNSASMTLQDVWIPPGTWYEDISGQMLTGAPDGSTIFTKAYDITEVPVFFRAGAIIPQIPVIEGQTLGLAQQQYQTIIFSVYPGTSSGQTVLYEDDGYTVDYLEGQFVYTTATFSVADDLLVFSVSSNGSYASFPTNRTIILRLMNSYPPTAVAYHNTSIPYSRNGGANTWTYDGLLLSTSIEISAVNTLLPFTLNVKLSPNNASALNGIKGGIYRAILAKQNLDEDETTPGTSTTTGGALDEVASAGLGFSYLAGANTTLFDELAQNYPQMFANALVEIANLTLLQMYDTHSSHHYVCANAVCLGKAGSSIAWIEGFQPPVGTRGTMSLSHALRQAFPHIVLPDKHDGLILAEHQDGTTPLSVWLAPRGNDYLVVASEKGVELAQSLGFTFGKHIGYVLRSTSEPEPSAQRLAYSLALLASGMT